MNFIDTLLNRKREHERIQYPPKEAT